jgi:hypothetical protein
MQPLDKTFRNRLERTVREARDVAEQAARAALEQLGVGEAAAFAHLSEGERELRRRLRVHGRQLGDTLDGGKAQTMERLTEEVAYEHWHRMLFARFLDENNLLMYPDPVSPVAVTLEECEDLAADEGAANGWELAARFAARMLPQIFRPDSPVFQLTLPPEKQQRLERLLADLPSEVFTASDSLGWVYQFWQAKRKDEVNNSEVKIGARELPAVTQLFTEPYMVAFLLDNSLGAWWAARRLSEDDLRTAGSEEELREKASLPGVPLEYLRFVRQDDGAWMPAAGTFDSWPDRLSELKILDPCCGSGHFLVATLLMLVPMRIELDGLTAEEAVAQVLRQNIHGLEIDKRCVELAAFALALTAWRYPDAGGYRLLPRLNIACSGVTVNAKEEDWLTLAGDNAALRLALKELYKQFKGAPLLGSLINPEIHLAEGSLFELQWDDVGPLLNRALANEQDYEKAEMAVVAEGIAEAANLLTNKYQLIITNPPYLTRGKQSQTLKEYSTRYFKVGETDLATVFFKRFSDFLSSGGTHASVTPLNWVLIQSYRALRKELLLTSTVHHVTRIGSGATAKASWDVLRALAIISTQKPTLSGPITGLEASSPDEENRAYELRRNTIKLSSNQEIRSVPDYRFAFDFSEEATLLGRVAESYQGIATADFSRFGRKFWERPIPNEDWEYQQSTVQHSLLYGGREHVLFWESGTGALSSSPSARIQGLRALKKRGIAVTQTRNLPATLYTGDLFDNNVAAIVVSNNENLSQLWCYCSSPEFVEWVRKLDEKLGVTNATFLKIPFDLEHWTKIAEEQYPKGLPKPYSDDPTQWIFHGHPVRPDKTLQVAVARLLGYRWPAELDAEMELSDEAGALVEKSKALLPFADADGIVCLPPVRGELPAAERLFKLLVAAYGAEWSNDTLARLLKQADDAGKTLDTWLRDKFFTQHCQLFHQRPFIWHVWDGLRDGFAALVNYHKLDYKNLEALIYTYLGDWITRQKQDITAGVDGAQEKLAAAEQLKKRLELILEGEDPYDIFVRWKALAEQPVGWNPDLNDGVRLNIRPFLSVPAVGKRGAGVLRDRPNIKWEKDRGKDVESAPWYHVFKGDRINDHHLKLDQKRKARQA